MSSETYHVAPEQAGLTLAAFLRARLSGRSWSQVRRLIQTRRVRVLGDEVHTAHDGIEAVEVAEQFRPQVILMDVGMPRLNGLDAARRIRAQEWGRRITIIALTGWGQDGDRARSREAGCDGHLVKPVSLPDLERALAGVKA